MNLLWVLLTLCCSIGWGAQFYSDRPHISKVSVRPSTEVQVVSEKALASWLDFVIEMRLFYHNKQRVYLARDGESLYEMDWLLWKLLNEPKALEPVIQNVSSKAVNHGEIWNYLEDGPLFTNPATDKIWLDTAFDASVIDAANKVLAEHGKRHWKASLISSTHPDFPSSRVSTASYFPEDWDRNFVSMKNKEAFLDLVDEQVADIEGAPHFTGRAIEFRVNPVTKKYEAFSPEDARGEVQKASLDLQKQIYTFLHRGPAFERASRILSEMHPFLSNLQRGEVEEEDVRAVSKFVQQHSYGLFWADLREAFAKHTFAASAASMQRLWSFLPDGLPALFDLESDELSHVEKLEQPIEVRFIDELLSMHQRLRRTLPNENMALHQKLVQLEKKYEEKPQIGMGYRGRVYDLGALVVKIPLEVDDVRYFSAEAMVSDFLTEHFSNYSISVLPIESRSPENLYLVRKKIPAYLLAVNIPVEKFTAPQRNKLEALFKNAKRFARETGVGLDLKRSNLAWWHNDWVLFDTGPRTSYFPYGFTLDLKDFESYLKIWHREEPEEVSGAIRSLGAGMKAPCLSEFQ